MERNGKHIAKEATNGIIYDSAGQIVHNGLLEICPFCGEMNNHFGKRRKREHLDGWRD